MTGLALISGGLAGAGIAVMIHVLLQQQLVLDGSVRARAKRAGAERRQMIAAWGTKAGWLRASDRDLDLANLTRGDLAFRKLVAAAAGLAVPGTVTLVLAIAGVSVPLTTPLATGLVLGLGSSMLPDVQVRREADRARRELTRATCAYLDLVALERAAAAGPVQALDQAAQIADSTAFARIAGALRTAELDGRHAWDGLAELGERTGIAALVDAADIMRLSGQDGTAAYNTLRARAASLRSQILAETTAKAHADSEHMVIPATAMAIVFVVFVSYPALTRLLG